MAGVAVVFLRSTVCLYASSATDDFVLDRDGPIVVGDFGQPHQDGACDHEGQCVLLAVWADVGARMTEILGSVTLEHLASITRGERPWPQSPDAVSS